jgi:dolichol-phosphate mannosyltransferase
MNLWVVLPAYNEAANLPTLFNGFHRLVKDTYNLHITLIVVDDGSTDETAAVAESFREFLPIEVYRNETNKGLAETFMRGILIAADKADPEDVVLCMDADNSHSPGLALRMLRDIQEGRDVVIASRYQPGAIVKGVPFHRRMLSLGMSVLFRVLHPIPGVKDYSCGYRAYRASFLQKALASRGCRLFRGGGFACMAGILLALGQEGAICGEVPIILRYDQKAGASKMKVFKTIVKTLSLLAAMRFGKSREDSDGSFNDP